MTIASDLLLDIATEKNGYLLGKPWRFTEFSLAAVVPIIREVDNRQRDYRLLSEVKGQVKIKDTGDIKSMEIANHSPFPVLMKAGELVAGATQSRALSQSQVVMPEEVLVAQCVCVHSTKGIRGGQQVQPTGISPHVVREAIYKGYQTPSSFTHRTDYGYTPSIQHRVWASVNMASASQSSAFQGIRKAAASDERMAYAQNMPESYRTPTEDLVGRLSEVSERFGEIIKKVPKVQSQVGIALLTIDGLNTLESFDHPGSWQAICDAILKAEADKVADVADQGGVFEFREEKAKGAIRTLLTSKFVESLAIEKNSTTTTLLDGGKFTGEVVTLYGAPIHCTFVKKA